MPELECRAVLKNTQLSPPETKEKERVSYGERIAALRNTQLESAIDDTEGCRAHYIKSAVLKNTQLSPPEIKEKERVPYEKRVAVLRNTQLDFTSDDTEGCRAHYIKPAVLKNTQPSPPEIKTKAYLLKKRRYIARSDISVKTPFSKLQP